VHHWRRHVPSKSVHGGLPRLRELFHSLINNKINPKEKLALKKKIRSRSESDE
jgi:hypothetical protein